MKATLDDLANAIRAHDFRVVIEPTPEGQFEVSIAARDGSFMRAVRPALAEAVDMALALHSGSRVTFTLHPERIVYAAPKPAFVDPRATSPHAFWTDHLPYCGICGLIATHPIHTLTGAPTPENGPTT